ncbi:MAG: glutamate--tRNA ligase [Spirochaetales bacterium]|nr:glutamate--tRNA ligase [Spirochaetales bacterium]|tara:strand:+ start:714 stop:2078 length:1365 start_codon:yes stop_codon:yes gene_type:complete
MSIVTRFAPSPTGSLHLGGVRTAIFNFLFARKNSGKLILRIEDTDQERSTVDSLDEIISSLKWLGVSWDEGPYFQSKRLDTYKKYAETLLDKSLAYKCFMTNEEIKQLKEEASKENKIYRYPKTWRNRSDHPDNADFVIRFKTPESKEIKFSDSLRGQISIDSSNIDDFIILKSDGFPTYNFASAVDDAEMGITNVIRGEDHLSNTPKQVLIFNAINKKIPTYTHVSMILGKDKAKLSKRHGAESIKNFKESGYIAIGIINYLARLGWSHGDQEIFSLNEMINLFSLDNLSKSPAIFDTEKLDWVNASHIKRSDNNNLKKLLELELYKEINVDLAIELTKAKSKNLNLLKASLGFCENEYVDISEELKSEARENDGVDLIKQFSRDLDSMDEFTEKAIRELFATFLEKNNIKMKNIASPLRIALTGSKVSPGIYEVIRILGKNLTLKRLRAFVS